MPQKRGPHAPPPHRATENKIPRATAGPVQPNKYFQPKNKGSRGRPREQLLPHPRPTPCFSPGTAFAQVSPSQAPLPAALGHHAVPPPRCSHPPRVPALGSGFCPLSAALGLTDLPCSGQATPLSLDWSPVSSGGGDGAAQGPLQPSGHL